MIGKLINDYIMTGRSTPLKDNPGGVGDVAMFPLVMQIVIISRGIITGGSAYLWSDALRDSIFTIVYLIIWISQIKHPLKMSRMYYLCPMKREERVVYLKNAYLFRSIFHSLLIVISCIALYVVSDTGIYPLLYILPCGLMYSFLSNVRDNKKDFVRAVILKPAMYISSYIQFTLPASGFKTGDLVFIACSFAFMLLIELPIFISLMRTVKEDIKHIAICEEGCLGC
jgi:hypothetical protein